MNNFFSTKSFLVFRRVIIILLAGLLIFYHIYTLAELFLGAETQPLTAFDYIQTCCRIGIVISLTSVILGVRHALLGMWLSIGSLVATQYWAHFGNLEVDFVIGRHPASYLKGFIFPTIITLLFKAKNKKEKTNSSRSLSE